MNKATRIISMLLILVTIAGACKKDAPLPDNLAGFESDNLGFPEDADNTVIRLRLSRAAESDVSIVVKMIPEGVVYGTDFTTVPASTTDMFTLTVPAGNSEATFEVAKLPGILFDGDERIVFKIQSVSSPALAGKTPELTLAFSEILSEEAEIDVNGGGPTFGNCVFIDLSANRQTAVERTSWDLGFFSGDDFRVILNYSTGMMARVLDKNNLNDVTAADTAGLDQEMSFNAFSTDALAYIDYPDGDLSKSAISAVSADASENKVYIVNRGTGIGSPAPSRGWKKIRVIRNASGGYTLQHADIGSATFTETEIPKAEDHFFTYTSFENGIVDVAPKKNKWDIAWTYFSNVTSFSGGEIPYGFQDFIIQNRNVGTAMVKTSDIGFEAFGEADLAGIVFNSKQNAIGPDWRAGGGPGSAPTVNTDRFYIIKDGDGNYYKVKFTALTKDGERGHVSFEHVLVKKSDL